MNDTNSITSANFLTVEEELDALLVFVTAFYDPGEYSRSYQLGLYYIAQHAEDNGFRVKIDNLCTNDHVGKRVTRLLNEYNCNILGFYTDHENIWFLRKIVNDLKKNNPALKIVLGGPQITGASERTMEQIGGADCGVIGEGEETFSELLRNDFNVNAFPDIAGLIFRDKGELIKTKPRATSDINKFSIPRRKELTINTNIEFQPKMITGRGCTGQCAFCYEGVNREAGKKIRIASTQKCLDEFEYLVNEFGESYKYISILDDTFVADPRRIREFCKELIKRYNGEYKWFCEARADTLYNNKDLLPLMVEAGLLRIQLGGESGNQKILDLYKKNTTLGQLHEVVEYAGKAGVFSIFANFIIGGAGETEETVEDTIKFAIELLKAAPGCIEVGSTTFSPCPGTNMTLHPEEYGIILEDPEMITTKGERHATCRTNALSKHKIISLRKDFEERTISAMLNLIPALDEKIIVSHFEAFYKLQVNTHWFSIFNLDKTYKNYFKALYTGDTFEFESAAQLDFNYMYPVRTIDLITSADGNYIVKTIRGKFREFDKVESLLLELSGGKISYDDIMKIFCDMFTDLDKNSIVNLLYEKFKLLSSERYIIWRTFS